MSTVTINDQYLHDIANSIRKMKRTSNPITTDSMAGEIESINIGYDPNEKWHRPIDWPDYSAIDISEFDGMYYTYDTTVQNGFVGITATVTGGYVVERGQIVNGVFTPNKATNVASGDDYVEMLEPTGSGYVVYKVYAQDADNPITRIGHVALTTAVSGDGTTKIYQLQPLLERYGRLPNVTTLYQWTNYRIVSDTVLDMGELTTMANCWYGDRLCENIDLTGFSSRPTSLASAFRLCASLKYLTPSNTFVTSACTNMGYAFYYCFVLPVIDTTGWDTSNVTNFSYTFSNCLCLYVLDVSHFNTAKATTMAYMFEYTYKLKTIDVSGFDTSKVTSFAYMFRGNNRVEALDVSHFDTSKATSMTYMFAGCRQIKTLDVSSFDTSNVTNMSYMFQACSCLESLDLRNFDVRKVTNASYMFSTAYGLRSVNLEGWNLAANTTVREMFDECYSLEDLNLNNTSAASTLSAANCFSATFSYMNKVKKIDLSGWDLSNLPVAYSSIFRYDYSVEEIIMPPSFDIGIGATTFDDCFSLKKLVLPATSVVPLANTNAFGQTPSTLVIYVPDNLVASYETAANWKNINRTFKGLSELE